MCVFWKTHVLQCTCKNSTTTTHTARRVQTQPPRKHACRWTKVSTSTTHVQCPPAVAPPVTARFTKPLPIMLNQTHQRNRHRLWSAPDAFASMGVRRSRPVSCKSDIIASMFFKYCGWLQRLREISSRLTFISVSIIDLNLLFLVG